MKGFWMFLLVGAALVVAAAAPAAAQPTSKSKPSTAAKSATKAKAPQSSQQRVARSPSEEIPPPATAVARSQAPPESVASLSATQRAEAAERNYRRLLLVSGISIFVLAVFVGFEVISKVPATLHTPLMSGSNAISGITVVGSIIAASTGWGFAPFLGFFATIMAMINVVGGFLVTHRMLLMFKRK